MSPRRLSLAAFLACLLARVTCYDFVREYSGSGFFDAWDFYGSWDNLTLGDVNWLDAADAWNTGLVSVNAAGNVVIRVDNSANVPWNFKRNAVRITTQDFYNIGTIWVLDAYHIPWGCSVWPSFWSRGENWPAGGEIDIIEGVNLMVANQISLHTTPGCTHDPTALQSGTNTAFLDCSTPAGCGVSQSGVPSFGSAFAQAGGGVWATQFDITGVYIWFWSRADVPPELYAPAGQGIDVSFWGVPTASFPSTTCSMLEFFTPQQIVIDTTLCGDWAGVPEIYADTCAGAPTSSGAPPSGVCYLDNVVGPGSPKYDEAYWEIAHLRVFTTGTNAPTAALAAAAGPTAATSGGSVLPSRGLRTTAAVIASLLANWAMSI